MFVETVFWSHPLAWWTGKRILGERERACDEAVLRTRCRPRAYAGAILRVCRLCVRSRRCPIGGSDKREFEKTNRGNHGES
jgi:beta-lactamase regulating signal transducer with metallopeptidase domain